MAPKDAKAQFFSGMVQRLAAQPAFASEIAVKTQTLVTTDIANPRLRAAAQDYLGELDYTVWPDKQGKNLRYLEATENLDPEQGTREFHAFEEYARYHIIGQRLEEWVRSNNNVPYPEYKPQMVLTAIHGNEFYALNLLTAQQAAPIASLLETMAHMPGAARNCAVRAQDGEEIPHAPKNRRTLVQLSPKALETLAAMTDITFAEALSAAADKAPTPKGWEK